MTIILVPRLRVEYKLTFYICIRVLEVANWDQLFSNSVQTPLSVIAWTSFFDKIIQ